MTTTQPPLTVPDLVNRLRRELPAALDISPLKREQFSSRDLFGGEWEDDFEVMDDGIPPLPRPSPEHPGISFNDGSPWKRRPVAQADSTPVVDPMTLGEWGEDESGEEVWRVPEVKEIPGSPEFGTDLLAWYTPFHVDPKNWGIYVREKGLHYLAQRIFEPEGVSYPTAIYLAMKLLYEHERFHFLTEMAATSMELASKLPLYIPYAASHQCGNRILSPLEEALAEANAFWPYRVHQCRLYPLKDAVETHMRNGSPGYRDFWQYVTHDSRGAGLQELAGQILSGKRGQPEPFGELAFDFDNRVVNERDVPVRLLRMRQGGVGSWLSFAKFMPAEQVEESNAFQKELEKCGSSIKKKWAQKKEQLRTEAINSHGLFFKKISRCPNRFFLRVEDNYRAILEPLPGVPRGRYLATRIMDHQEYDRILKRGCK